MQNEYIFDYLDTFCTNFAGLDYSYQLVSALTKLVYMASLNIYGNDAIIICMNKSICVICAQYIK